MSEQMDVLSGEQVIGEEHGDFEMAEEEQPSVKTSDKSENHFSAHKNSTQGIDITDSSSNVFFASENQLKVEIPDISLKTPSKEIRFGADNNNKTHEANGINVHKSSEEELSPPVLVNTHPFQRELTPPTTLFQKPSVCRTHSLGAGDHSPFALRRRSSKMSLPNQLQSPSAFKRRRLCMQSPIRCDLFDSDENVLKRCNSAPMLNDINDMDTRPTWHHSSVTPGTIRARRFSATVLSVHASPSAGTSKSTSRLHQLKKEESLEGIQYKETAHEREVQTSIQMYHTCEELSLTDTSDNSNGIISGAGDAAAPKTPVTTHATLEVPRSPLPSSAPVNIPSINKQCPTRAIDFGLPLNGAAVATPHHSHHSNGGGIPSPLTISPSSCLLSLSPLPPSPTRGLGLSSTGKQCFSPSMQAPVPVCLRPGSLSPSPSPTRRTFVTRRRSQSPCIMKPSALGPIKRKYDSDSEGGCSPKRMFIPGSNNTGHLGNSHPDTPVIVTPFFSRTIHRSHSLSSSSIDSDPNVSPSPPQQNGVNHVFLPSNHALVGNSHLRESINGSPFQSPLYNHFLGPNTTHQEVGRCSSPASSTCSSSSLEGLKDLQPFSQTHLNMQSQHTSNGINHPLLIKHSLKDQQSSIVSTATSTADVSL